MTKRIFALLLALVLVVGLLPMGTLAAETPSAWDGTTVTEPKKVDGVYQIGTAEKCHAGARVFGGNGRNTAL